MESNSSRGAARLQHDWTQREPARTNGSFTTLKPSTPSATSKLTHTQIQNVCFFSIQLFASMRPNKWSHQQQQDLSNQAGFNEYLIETYPTLKRQTRHHRPTNPQEMNGGQHKLKEPTSRDCSHHGACILWKIARVWTFLDALACAHASQLHFGGNAVNPALARWHLPLHNSFLWPDTAIINSLVFPDFYLRHFNHVLAHLMPSHNPGKGEWGGGGGRFVPPTPPTPSLPPSLLSVGLHPIFLECEVITSPWMHWQLDRRQIW